MILIFKFYFFHKDRNYLYPIIDIKQSKNRMFAANISFLIALYIYNLSVIT